ncbi:hypothetical protein CDLVIII_5645 [Clostridium sp. DL-VIII]|uniref:hypothetical protein n=1 Tax=Clostridium sp. DL-VIII TaxID=641107 RepID=UPI00023B0723|nr:hypothetical protein [Clostridium sp. DL-VIII]EHJ02116.1 hypothetical protein CDLVIII_5645 [Clostridium sp. DL-VIII]
MMFNKRSKVICLKEKLLIKLLVLSVCTIFLQPTVAFAESTGRNVIEVPESSTNNAVQLFDKSIMTGLISKVGSVAPSANINQTIQVRIEECGDFIKSLNTKNIIFGR